MTLSKACGIFEKIKTMKRYIHIESKTTLAKLKNKRIQVSPNKEGTAFKIILSSFSDKECIETIFERGIRYTMLYLTKETIEEIYYGMITLEQLKEEQR